MPSSLDRSARSNEPVRAVRSTLLLASRASLTSSGLFDDYERHLPDQSRSLLREIIAGTWLPIDLVMTHYRACDALGLSRAEQVGLGRANGERLSGTLLGTLAKIARSAGTTPLVLIEQFPRFWSRIVDGGAISTGSRGPKDVDIVVCASPLLTSPHFRHGAAGTAESMLSLVSTRVFVRVKEYRDREGSATYLTQWV